MGNENYNYGENYLNENDHKLHVTDEVESAVESAKRKGKKVSQKPVEKIEVYLNRIKDILNPEELEGHKNFDRKERNIEMLKESLYDNVIIKEEDIPEGYYENQKRLAREQGHGDIDITEEMRKQLSEVVVKDQETTLDNWTSYFTSPDSDSYPMWAKYWAFTSMLKLSTFDKEKHTFAKRDKGTVAPFPDLNREALAYVVDAIIKKAKETSEQPKAEGMLDTVQSKKSKERSSRISLAESNMSEDNKKHTIQKLKDLGENPELEQILENASFGKLYAYAIEKVTPTEKNELETTEGEWIKYDQNSDHRPLVKSLQTYGTGWCTAGEFTAKEHLKGGDFYVYYSNDKNGKPIIPRVAIRMNGESIGEVRGIAHDQNMDPYIGDVVKEKLAQFPDGKQYEKKEADMKLLTKIENKIKVGEKLNKDELLFIYEIDSKIEGFGYQRDPRIKEIMDQRNLKEDAPIVFESEPNQIAYSEKEINKNTKVYIGEFNPKVLKSFPKSIEHVYTKFPEQKFFFKEIIPDPEINSDKTAIKKLEAEGHKITGDTNDMLSKVDWTERLKSSYEIVSISVGELFGDKEAHTYADIKAKAKENNLELIPAKLAPTIRLNYEKSGQWTNIAMEAIRDRSGSLKLFACDEDDSHSWLNDRSGRGDFEWRDDRRFFFVRK